MRDKMRESKVPGKMRLVSAVLLCLTLTLAEETTSSRALPTLLRVSDGGVYSRLQVVVEEQGPPKNCTEYLDNLEVSRRENKNSANNTALRE